MLVCTRQSSGIVRDALARSAFDPERFKERVTRVGSAKLAAAEKP
jgi:hypothetical protein